MGRARVNLRAYKYLGCFVIGVANWVWVQPVHVEPADGVGWWSMTTEKLCLVKNFGPYEPKMKNLIK